MRIVAHELYPNVDTPLDPAPVGRDWMDAAHQRHPYRCLPLVIANQAGWVLRSPVAVSAYWLGGPAKEDVELRFDGPVDARIVSHFGSGVVTFTVPFLFRTPPGVNLWVKGPSNWVKDGVQPLEGVIEADWAASTFTMNWKLTRPGDWVRWEKGEPYGMLVPVPRGLVEALEPTRGPIEADPELVAQYKAWEAGRKGFLAGLQAGDPEAVKRGWQKDYFQGKASDGTAFPQHQTKLAVRPFLPTEEERGRRGEEEPGG